MTFRVDKALDLPIGARLQLAVPAGSPAGVASGDAEPDAIARALAELFQIRPATDRALDTPQVRPLSPDTSLAARLLRLIGALPTASSGVAEAAPGTAAEAASTATSANRGQGHAAADLGRPANEASLGGWRVHALPFGLEDPLGLRFYVREDPGDGERSNQGQHGEPSPQRAIFELDFSHVGRCQVDVLCQGKRFDLILRTEGPLEADIQADIRALFVAARDAAGWAGEISFRADDLVALPTPTTPIQPVTA